MENNIPTLYILELGSFVVKSAKISTILCPFVQKKQSCIRVAMVWNGMEKLYLNRVALSARRLVSIGALYLDISYL